MSVHEAQKAARSRAARNAGQSGAVGGADGGEARAPVAAAAARLRRICLGEERSAAAEWSPILSRPSRRRMPRGPRTGVRGTSWGQTGVWVAEFGVSFGRGPEVVDWGGPEPARPRGVVTEATSGCFWFRRRGPCSARIEGKEGYVTASGSQGGRVREGWAEGRWGATARQRGWAVQQGRWEEARRVDKVRWGGRSRTGVGRCGPSAGIAGVGRWWVGAWTRRVPG